MNVRRQKQIALAVAALLVLTPVGVGVAQTLTHTSTAGVNYVTNSGVNVELGDGREVTAQPFADDTTFAQRVGRRDRGHRQQLQRRSDQRP